MSWGSWEEDRRYPDERGEYLIVVSKRVDGEGKTHWKNERRRKLTPAEREDFGRLRVPVSLPRCGPGVVSDATATRKPA